MQPETALTVLFRHHLWANLRLLEHCAKLSAEQLEARIAGSYGSIYETLQHITTSERSYFSRISTGQPYAHPEDTPPMSMAEMAEALRQTGEGLIDWAPRVQAGDAVEVNWRGTPRQVPKSIILTQVINHATEHREQIKAIMTELEIEPPDLQGWTYFEETDQ